MREILILVALTSVVFLAVVETFRPFLAMVDGFGDNGDFLGAASAIRRWNFQGFAPKAFWGLPYVIASISFVTGISARSALLLISYAAGFAAIALVNRLWGGWIAGFFAVLNFDWMERLCLGGAESLFVTCVFGAFLAARRERWFLAAFLAAFATIVRPIGIFALVAIGIILLWRRDFRNFGIAVAIGAVVGGMYVLPMAMYYHSPLVNLNTYQQEDWQGGRLLTWPFGALLQVPLRDRPPVTNIVLTWTWILFVFAGFAVLVLGKRCREYWMSRPLEIGFAVSYLSLIYCYNSPHWLQGNFPRFAIPVLPLVLLALLEWLPKDRRLLWGLAVVSPMLAACSAVGIRNVAMVLRRGML